MIKVAHIMPTSYLSRFSAARKDVGMALAHLVLADSRYRQNYDRSYKRYGFVILDNSAFELGAAVDDTELIKAALLVQPDEIVLPDVLFDADQTLSRIRQFLAEHAQSVKGLSFMAVPHGNTLDAYINSYVTLAAMADVSTIGIGTIYNKRFKQDGKMGREVIFDALFANDLLVSKQHHLLGLGDDGNLELARLSKFDCIRSCDSSAAYTNAHAGASITPKGYKKPQKKVNFDDPYSKEVLRLLQKNAATLERSMA